MVGVCGCDVWYSIRRINMVYLFEGKGVSEGHLVIDVLKEGHKTSACDKATSKSDKVHAQEKGTKELTKESVYVTKSSKSYFL